MKQLPIFNTSKILVVGDVMLDRYWYGDAHRISPEAPVPVVQVQKIKECVGGAGNVALNIASLGSCVHLLGIIGKDEAGECLKKHLDNIQGHLQQEPSVPTITKLRVMAQSQQLIRLDFEESLTKIDKTILEQQYDNLLPELQVIVLSDYGKGTLSTVQNLIAKARVAHVPVLVDPKGTDFECYRGATLLTPNLKEFELIVGHCATEEVLVTRGLNLMHSLELASLVITRGSQGMTLLQPHVAPLHLPALAREVYDVTGAGDTVVATLAGAMAANCSLADATILANIAAGIVVGHVGAASITVAELEAALLN